MRSEQKFIAWDWNGTLQDDLNISVVAANINLQRIGKPPIDADTYRQYFDVPIDRLYRNMGFTEQEITDCLDSAQSVFFEIYERMIDSTDFRPGAAEVLDLASQHSVAHIVLSNHLTESIEKDLHRLQKRDSFHTILAWPSRAAQFREPKGTLLTAFMKEKNLKAENGLIVGDTPEEVKVAREIGLISVAISGGYNSLELLEQAKPDHLIHHLHELPPILRQHGFLS